MDPRRASDMPRRGAGKTRQDHGDLSNIRRRSWQWFDDRSAARHRMPAAALAQGEPSLS